MLASTTAATAYATSSRMLNRRGRTAKGLDVERWAARCLAGGVRFQTAKEFTFDGRARAAFRIGFASPSEAQLERAVQMMAGKI